MNPEYVTRFGSLTDHESGGVDVVDDDPRHYAFSNVFDVAARARPWEKVAVGRNLEYVLEVVRAEGVSAWRVAAHDETLLVMDGEVVVDLVELAELPATTPVGPGLGGSVALPGEPVGARMGRVTARRGHQVLLPAGAAHRVTAPRPAVLVQQTVAGPDTVYRWRDICQTVPTP